jgi:hypothetical protein
MSHSSTWYVSIRRAAAQIAPSPACQQFTEGVRGQRQPRCDAMVGLLMSTILKGGGCTEAGAAHGPTQNLTGVEERRCAKK